MDAPQKRSNKREKREIWWSGSPKIAISQYAEKGFSLVKQRIFIVEELIFNYNQRLSELYENKL